MRRTSFILLLGCLFIWVNEGGLYAQGTIQGQITDAQTGKPLSGANVFLSGTKMGAGANVTGHFSLEEIPAGGYRLVISIIGYERKIVDIIIGYEESLEMDFELKPVVYELPALHVRTSDEEWEDNLERFIDHFIGRSGLADSVEILNPEVLVFDENWWGKLSAKALVPLRIENRALGYYITYYLKEFSHGGSTTRWDGEPLFTKIEPADSVQAAYWERNRRKAFYGSLRHFLLALINHSTDEEEFIIYNQRQGIRGYSASNKRRISGERIIEEGEKDFLYELNFFGRLEIRYLREDEALEYVEWLPRTYRAPRESQTSYLDLNEHPVTVDADGEILQPYGATQYGYFSFQRIAYLTPRGYRPENY